MAKRKNYDINYGHLGNGLTVWNRAEEKNGDYVTVAHIGPDRSVKFYDKDLPEDIKAKIEHIARTSDERASYTQQEQRVFYTPPQALDCTSTFSRIGKSLDDEAEDISPVSNKQTLAQRLLEGQQKAARHGGATLRPTELSDL